MDIFLGKLTQQAMNYAIRSGVTLTASYAIRQSAKLLNNAPKSDVRDELLRLQQRLQHKIRIISPAIDMIELIAARGNTSLESAVSLTKDLRLEIQTLGHRLARAANASENTIKSTGFSGQAKAQHELELKLIISDIRKLLERIEDSVPLINLAITTSGASLSTSLPHTVSPSRLLQASTFLTAGDTQYSLSPQEAVQIGPTFTLTVYMLFAGHNRPQDEDDIRETTWKEVMHKAKVKLRRVPLEVIQSSKDRPETIPVTETSSAHKESSSTSTSRIPADVRADEYGYQIVIIEDLDDDRVHDFEDHIIPGAFDDVKLAGLREVVPIHQVSKIFYADTSKVLNIGTDAETNHPVLLLKRDINAVPPRRTIENEQPDDGKHEEGLQSDEQETQYKMSKNQDDTHRDPWQLPPSLDPEWIAFEVYTEDEESQEGSEAEADDMVHDPETSQLEESLADLSLKRTNSTHKELVTQQPPPWVNAIKTSLSLLELLLRLTSLQQFEQQSHLSIRDELLNFFLEESASTGAGGNESYRQGIRSDARRRVGWDPYDESPLKRRGEDYQYYAMSPSPSGQPSPQANVAPRGQNGGAWSPVDAHTRSMTAFSDGRSPSASPSPGASKQKLSWIKRQDERKGSPLRPLTAMTDEGIGSSPGSGVDGSTMEQYENGKEA